MKAKVYVTLKTGVFDPQGKTVLGSLQSLGYQTLTNVRVGKLIELQMETKSKKEAEAQLKEMCERFLANTVIEDYKIFLE